MIKFNRKILLLLVSIFVFAALNVEAKDKTNIEKLRDMARQARKEGKYEKAKKYEDMANETQEVVEDIEKMKNNKK